MIKPVELIFSAGFCYNKKIKINVYSVKMRYNMELDKFIKNLEQMEGNYFAENGDTYISLVNIEKGISFLENTKNIENMLITPFLINIENGMKYELHYYEFELECKNISKSIYLEYPKDNKLPKEIINNLKPKAIISIGDILFFINALHTYLNAMKIMRFEYEKKIYTSNLNNYILYFQIY